MTTQSKQLKNPPLKSRVLNANASDNQQVQNYQKQVFEKAKKDIAKIEDDIKQLEQNQRSSWVRISSSAHKLPHLGHFHSFFT